MPGKIMATDGGQKISGGPDQAGLLGPVYTGGGSAIAAMLALTHLDEDQRAIQIGQHVDFTCLTVQIAGQDARALLY